MNLSGAAVVPLMADRGRWPVARKCDVLKKEDLLPATMLIQQNVHWKAMASFVIKILQKKMNRKVQII